MNQFINQQWWVFLLRGILAIIVGITAIFMPGVTLTILIILFGTYMVIDGIFTLISAANNWKTLKNKGWYIVAGLLNITIGVLTFISPITTAVALIYLVAFWAFVIGIFEIAAAIRLRNLIKGEGWYISAGALSILFSVLIMFYPIAGALTLSVMFGVYTLILGVFFMTLSFRLRQRSRGHGHDFRPAH